MSEYGERPCGQCGASLEHDARFCVRCGRAADNPSAEAPPTAPTMTVRPSTDRAATPVDAAAARLKTAGATSPISLVAGERELYRGEFTPLRLRIHLRSVVVVTDSRVIVQTPQTLLGLIPHGYSEGSAPLEHVSGVLSGDITRTLRLVYGTAAALFGLFLLLQSGGQAVSLLFALVLLAVGGYLAFTARELAIVFRAAGSVSLGTAAAAPERDELDRARQLVNELLVTRGGSHE